MNPLILKVIRACQQDPAFFINNFCTVKHPKLGMLPFKLFSYQKRCLKEFVKYKYNIFRKCRQCGISTLTGAYALWSAMFSNDKTVLIVSKRDDDAKEYLNRNVKFPYSNLPEWMRKLWKPEIINEHTLAFTNGSVIRSLTSSPDTLRSNASSLNIIDEAAFIDKMEDMWSGGWSTMQHGGSAIVISTPKGIGNWYWKTWVGAIDKVNDFNPIIINWWDMDWELKFKDELTGTEHVIAPTAGLKVLDDPREISKYGPGPNGKTYWSPWLEGEYRNLATKGDDSKFRQEVLAEFIGSGSTVLSREALQFVDQTNNEEYISISQVDYTNPSTGEKLVLDFQERLWIWEKPYTKYEAEKAISEARTKGVDPKSLPYEYTNPHIYVVGADPSSGEANDYCAVQVVDITTQRQVAELKIKVLPKTFARMVDYIGRMYNNAHVVCERTGIGQSVVQELDKDLMYPNLYRHSRTTASLKTKYSHIGFPTNNTTKPTLIKYLLDHVGDDGGYLVTSTRLYHELCIFIHLGNGKYGNEPGIGNTDDLVMAFCLALAGIQSALRNNNVSLIPLHNIDVGSDSVVKPNKDKNKFKNYGVMTPIGITSEMYTNKTTSTKELDKFMMQLGGIPLGKNVTAKADSVVSKKHILRKLKE